MLFSLALKDNVYITRWPICSISQGDYVNSLRAAREFSARVSESLKVNRKILFHKPTTEEEAGHFLNSRLQSSHVFSFPLIKFVDVSSLIMQIDIFPYSVFYIFFEQYLDIWKTALINIGIALGIPRIKAVSLFFL